MDKIFLQTIKFGTDGWRGIIGFDFNNYNLERAVYASCQELYYQYFKKVKTKKVLIGYDRRFMAKNFAESIIPIVSGCGLEPILSSTYVTTPSCSLYVKEFNLLGALIITASHNPYNWLGLKIKSFKGCSVDESFTKAVQQRINLGNIAYSKKIPYKTADVKKYHLEKIRSKFDIKFILGRLEKMNLRVFIDSMHGAAANSIDTLFGGKASNYIKGIRENQDPYFGGNPPEPLLNYLNDLKTILNDEAINGIKTLGIVFDGDGDRIAVIDEKGRYCSTQDLIPFFINYLGNKNKNTYPVLKTVSGSNIIKKISENQNRKVIELPVGFKYIAEKMISENIFIGGEESGGVGFGDFLPERDALYSAMILLNGIAEQSKLLHESLDEIQIKFGPSFYDRLDIKFSSEQEKEFLESNILCNLPKKIFGIKIENISRIDGIKLILNENHWILFRFSGTEPLLRIYCEAPTEAFLSKTLSWSKDHIKNTLGQL